MRPKKAATGRRRSSGTAASPEREPPSFGFGASSDRSSVSSPTYSRAAASLLDDEHAIGYLAGDGSRWLRDYPIFEDQNRESGGRVAGGPVNPRSFPYSVKQQCWEKAEKVKGRDPDRWRRDPLGNIIFRKLVGCPGCLCHDYDHILPYSKGGQSTLDNCQVLQATVNRSKGNKTEISESDLMQKSAYCRVSGRDMDLLELSAYGNVRRGQDSIGCNIQ